MTSPDAPAPGPVPGSSPADAPAAEGPRHGVSAQSPEDGGQPGAGDGTAAGPEDHGVGSGSAASEAISQPGQGSLRSEYLREADRLAGEGDGAGHGARVVLIGRANQVRISRLSRRLVQPVLHAFVPPEEFDETGIAFAKSRTVILRGPAGYGKQAIAIRMLLNLCRGDLFQLDSAVDLSQLAESVGMDLQGGDRIEQGAGFLLNAPSNFGSLYGSVLHNLDDALERADARLVLTVDSSEPVPDDDLLDYIVNIRSVPPYSDIVASRLRFRLSPEQAALLLARSDVRRVIDDQLAAGPSCKLAADLADDIAAVADAADDEESLDIALITARNEQRGAESFDTWFAGLGDTRTRSFAVALAVLNGLPYDAVAQAARALYRSFEPPPYMVMAAADDVRPQELRPFRASRQEWLLRLRARIRETEVQGAYGRSMTEAVEYQDPDYAIKVIRRAWSDYEVQDALISWLGTLSRDATEQVRIFAGTALGRLSIWSFDFLSYRVLAPWANGKVREQREAVAYALRVVAASPRLRGNARQLMSAWYANSSRPLAQATAARAYGVAYGPIDPAEAFRRLDRLCKVDDIRIVTAIGSSVADLLEAGTDEFACTVLDRLAEAVADPESSAAVQLVFLMAADGLVDWEREPAGEGQVRWPFLLRLTTRVPEVRRSVVYLWQYVLNEALFHEEAEQVITRWAAAAEAHPLVLEAFLRLARAIARTSARSLHILELHCDKWASPDSFSPLPAVCSALRTILTAEKEAR